MANKTVDIAKVRFADERDDAIDTDVEGEPVKDDGVLLIVDDFDTEGVTQVPVGVTVYHDADDHRAPRADGDGGRRGRGGHVVVRTTFRVSSDRVSAIARSASASPSLPSAPSAATRSRSSSVRSGVPPMVDVGELGEVDGGEGLDDRGPHVAGFRQSLGRRQANERRLQ